MKIACGLLSVDMFLEEYEGVEEVLIWILTMQYQLSSLFSNLPEAFDSFWKELYTHI